MPRNSIDIFILLFLFASSTTTTFTKIFTIHPITTTISTSLLITTTTTTTVNAFQSLMYNTIRCKSYLNNKNYHPHRIQFYHPQHYHPHQRFSILRTSTTTIKNHILPITTTATALSSSRKSLLKRLLDSSSPSSPSSPSSLLYLQQPFRTTNLFYSKTTTTSSTTTTMNNSTNDHSLESNNNSNVKTLRYCDIGANLLDDRYIKGIYRGTLRHEPDINEVIERAIESNVYHIIITAGTIEESCNAIQQVQIWNNEIYNKNNIHFSCTVGVHPTRCSQIFIPTIPEKDDDNEPISTIGNTSSTTTIDTTTYANERIQELYQLCYNNIQSDPTTTNNNRTVVAYGELGLDYDRLEFCNKDIQQNYCIQQLINIALPLNLPLFLHNRNVNTDLYSILKNIQTLYNHNSNDTNIDNESILLDDDKNYIVFNNISITKEQLVTLQNKWNGQYHGVVHSFDDTIDLAQLFINELNLYIGINGCSLRTEQNIQTIQQLSLDRILLETELRIE